MSANQNSSPDVKRKTPAWRQHIRQDVQSMHAYAIQDSTGMVKLDAMENPFGLSARIAV
jgi:histidinol-phosphate aminotransferase